MIDVLNACGVDVVCFGNHETDIPHKALLQRIHESQFVWVRAFCLPNATQGAKGTSA
jgi:2',3'-cyclic-nucleotide 2'-phosphodiesterase (5'-nucleotidase family)